MAFADMQQLFLSGERIVIHGPLVFNSPEHGAQGELLWSVNVRRASCVVRRAASTITLKVYFSYTPGPQDSTNFQNL